MATVPAGYVTGAFTANTVLQLIHYLKVDERYLHRSANKAVQALQRRASQEPGIVVNAIQGLVLWTPGVYNFDAITKTKTVAKLLAVANLPTFVDLIPTIHGAIKRPQAIDDKQADAKRRAFADVLVSICTRTLAMISEENDAPRLVAGMVLDALIGLAYSNNSLGMDGRTFEPPPSSACREYFRSRVRTCLDHSLQHSATKAHLLRHTIDSLKAVQEQADPDDTTVEFDTETQKIVDTAWKSVRKISKNVRLANC